MGKGIDRAVLINSTVDAVANAEADRYKSTEMLGYDYSMAVSIAIHATIVIALVKLGVSLEDALIEPLYDYTEKIKQVMVIRGYVFDEGVELSD